MGKFGTTDNFKAHRDLTNRIFNQTIVASIGDEIISR